MWCGISPAVLTTTGKGVAFLDPSAQPQLPGMNVLGREGEGERQNSPGTHVRREMLGAVFWGLCRKALRKLPNTQKPFKPKAFFSLSASFPIP